VLKGNVTLDNLKTVIMKKLLFMIIVLLVSGAVIAQGSKGKMTSKSFLAFHGGPSFTVGDFGSRSQTNESAAFAKTGFNINLNYGYNFNKNIGLTGGAFYSRYNLDKAALTAALEAHNLPSVGVNADHWQFYGVAVGPMFTHEVTGKIAADLRLMGGASKANLPKGTYEGTVASTGAWSWTPMFQGGLDLRFNTGSKVFIFTNADYMWMQPEFKYDIILASVRPPRFHQNISVVNLTGGVGIKF